MTYMAGFGLVATLAEDANMKPSHIGRLVVATVLLAGAFYCIVLTASAWILPWEEVAQMEQGTITAFEVAGFPLLSWGAFGIAILGLLTSFLSLFIATSRIIVAMARVELLPKSLAAIDPKHDSPRNALLLVMALTICLGWLGPGAITWFLDTGGIYLGLVWIIVVVSHHRIGSKYPHLVQNMKSSLVLPVIGAAGAALVIAFAMTPGTNMSLVWPAEYIILALWFLLGIFLLYRTPEVRHEEALADLLGEYAGSLTKEERRDDVIA